MHYVCISLHWGQNKVIYVLALCVYYVDALCMHKFAPLGPLFLVIKSRKGEKIILCPEVL